MTPKKRRKVIPKFRKMKTKNQLCSMNREIADFGRRLAEMPGGMSLLTLLVEDSHRRLVNRVRHAPTGDERSVENLRQVLGTMRAVLTPTVQAPATTTPSAPPTPREPSEPGHSNDARRPGDTRSLASSHGTSMVGQPVRRPLRRRGPRGEHEEADGQGSEVACAERCEGGLPEVEERGDLAVPAVQAS